MGYAMFCARKLMLVSQINDLQYRIVELTMQQQSLAGRSSAIQAQRQANYFNGQGGLTGSVAPATNAYDIGNQGQNPNTLVNNQSGMTSSVPNGSVFDDTAAQFDLYKISQAEKQIEMEMKRLETLLSAKQQEYEAVQKGEEQAIKMATPKYA